jgi:hypothetical protein
MLKSDQSKGIIFIRANLLKMYRDLIIFTLPLLKKIAIMGKDITNLYDRKKSIKANALAIGVSERVIKYHIAKNNISRIDDNRHQRLSELVEAKEQLEKSNIKPTIENLKGKLGWSKNTVHKYLLLFPKEDTKKCNHFGIKYSQVIKNVFFNQSELLYSIMILHNKGRGFECDMTYSKGGFYEKSKVYYVPQPKIKMDVEPQFDDVIKLETLGRLPIADSSIQSLVVDLPFIVATDRKAGNPNSNIIQKRFSAYYPKEELFKSYLHWMTEVYRVLQYNGICVWKSQACITGKIQIMLPELSFWLAYKRDLYCIDQFFLIGKNRPHSGKIQHQEHARKYTSTFYVFQKTKKQKVDYFEWMK